MFQRHTKIVHCNIFVSNERLILLNQNIEGNGEGLISALDYCLDGIRYVLQSFWGIGVDSEGYRDALLAVPFVAMENDNATFLSLANMHDAEVETIGGETDVVRDTDWELTHEGFFGCDTVAYH
jgi:hypothetical protein